MSDRSPEIPGGGAPFKDPTPPESFVLQDLTPREMDVLALLTRGDYNKLIARELAVRVGTAKTHVHAIMNKLESRFRNDAVLKAHRLGLVRL